MDAKGILELRDNLQKHRRLLDQRMFDVLSYYNLERVPKVPGDFDYHVPPSARTIPEGLAAALHPTDIIVTVPPRTQKRGKLSAEEQASKLELAHYDWLTRIDRSRGFSLLQEALKQALLFGLFVFKGPFLNIDLWDRKPKKAEGQSIADYELVLEQWENQRRVTLPIDLFSVSPLNVYPDPALYGGGEPQYVIETYKRLAGEVKRYVTVDDDFAEIEWIEYHDKTQRIYLVDETIVQQVNNPTGYIPYHFGFSSLGINSPQGRPEEKAMGIMYPILSNLAAEIRLMTMMDIVAQIYGIPPFRKISPFTGKIDLTPGFVNPETVLIEPLFSIPPGVGDTIINLLLRNDQEMEWATYSRTLAAIKLAGVSTGIQQQLLTLQAYKRYEPLVHVLEDVWGKIGGRIAWVVENLLKASLNEYITPAEIAGYYVCKVHFIIVEALERQVRIEEMRALRTMYSDKTLRKHFNVIPQAEDEEEQLLLEILQKHPAFLQAAAQRLIERGVGAEQLKRIEKSRKAGQFTSTPETEGFLQPTEQARGTVEEEISPEEEVYG